MLQDIGADRFLASVHKDEFDSSCFQFRRSFIATVRTIPGETEQRDFRRVSGLVQTVFSQFGGLAGSVSTAPGRPSEKDDQSEGQ